LKIENAKFEYLLTNYNFKDIHKKEITAIKKWNLNRIDFFNKKNVRTTYYMIKNLKFDWQLGAFELFLNLAPAQFTNLIIKKLKK